MARRRELRQQVLQALRDHLEEPSGTPFQPAESHHAADIADVLWLGPSERPTGIVLQDRVALVSEPRLGLDPVFTLRSGVSVAVLGEGSAWTRVEVRDRTGYLPTEAVGVVR